MHRNRKVQGHGTEGVGGWQRLENCRFRCGATRQSARASYAQPRTGLLPWLYLSTNCALAFRSLNISPMLLQSPPWFRTCSLDATDRRPPIAFQLTQVTRAKSCGLPQEMATARQARRAGRVAVPALARRATAPLPEQPTPRQALSVRPAKVADVTQSAHHMQPSTSYPALRPAHL